MTSGRQRLALAVLLAVCVAVAFDASVRLPLWEPIDEAAVVLQAQHPLDSAPGAASGVTAQPLAARALAAGGLRLLGLQDVEFLARTHVGGTPRDPFCYLHGPDEVAPFVGPARGLHELRLLSVAFGAVAVWAAFVLARRLIPQRPGVALLAAALLGLLPPFVATCGSLGPVALQTALFGAALVPLAALATGQSAKTLRLLLTGALLGAAHLAGAPLLLVLPLGPIALALGRAPGEGWRARLAPLDRLAAGFLVVTGPWFAWRWVHAAAPAASIARTSSAGAVLARWLPLLAWGHVARTAPGVALGPAGLLAWSSLAALAALGLLRLARHARRADSGLDRRVASLVVAAILLATAGSLIEAFRGRAPDGRDLLPVGGAVGGLLAAGLATWLPVAWPRLTTLVGGLLILALAALAAWHIEAELGPAFQPLNRVQDPHLMCFDPLAGVTETQRLATIHVVQPADGAHLDAPPELRWTPVREADTRYTVHVSSPGAAWTLRCFEDRGVSLYDRYLVPAAIWDALPPEVDLVLRVVRVPALDEVLSGEPPLVDESLPIRVRHKTSGGS